MTHEDIAKLPYRPCVGLMVVNRDGNVFVGQHIGSQHLLRTHEIIFPPRPRPRQ